MIKRLFVKVIDLLRPYEIPENHETCPSCKGTGSEDGVTSCEYCGGYGHVSAWEALKYEQK